MKCFICIIGSELMLPGFEDSHFSFLKSKLWPLGIDIVSSIYIPDDISIIYKTLEFAYKIADFIVLTGGLGPTEDDLTKDGVIKFLNTNFVFNPSIRDKIVEKFSKMGKEPPQNSFKQAMVIKGSEVIENEAGIAPGLLIEREEKKILLLPGPPVELENVLKNFLNRFMDKLHRGEIYRNYKIVNISEPIVDEKIKRISDKIKDIEYTILSKMGDIEVIVRTKSEEQLRKFEEEVEKEFRESLYSKKGESLNEVVSSLLVKRGFTISVAESCTGGYLGKLLTDIPGSSRYFLGGIISYSNEVKIHRLGIDREVIEKYGAVSSQVGIMMAAKIKEKFKSDIGVGITGIAGPEGGSREKPVGTVYIGVSIANKVKIKKFTFSGDREGIRKRASHMALNMVRKTLLEKRK